MKDLADKGVDVVGVSGDSVQTQALFKKHNKLPYTLLADEDGAIAKKFGVPVRPGGEIKVKDPEHVAKRGVTLERWTFVIGQDGTILYKNPKANAAKDSKVILEVIGKLEK